MVTICAALLSSRKEVSKHEEVVHFNKAVSDAEAILERIETSVGCEVAYERGLIERRIAAIIEDLKSPDLDRTTVAALHSDAAHLFKMRRRARASL